jgi:hypothetical protein
MLESLVVAFNAVKQATPTLLLGVALAAAALLFLPEAVVGAVGLNDLLRTNRPYVGAALLVSVAILAAQAFVAAIAFGKGMYLKRKAKRVAALAEQQRLERLTKLTPEERAYLIPYIATEINTCYFSIEDGIAGGLQAKGIIYRSANIGDMVTGFAFNLQPWAREHLNQNPQLLEGARAPERRSRW